MSKKHFKSIIAEATHSMPVYRRVFSRFIHIKPIASASDILASTIARPNAILLGALFSFVFTLATYLLAKNYGYSLSGFEAIAAFVVGWSIGMVFDVIAFVFRKK